MFIFKWLRNALHWPPIVAEGGRQTRGHPRDDVVRAWTLAIQGPAEGVVGQKFFVGRGEKHTVEELAFMCRDAFGLDVPIEYVGYRPGEAGQREDFSTEKARRMLGYEAGVSAGEAIRLTADWARSLVEAGPGEV